MMAGRARWKVENETIQTLKAESSYNLEHSYGYGKLHTFLVAFMEGSIYTKSLMSLYAPNKECQVRQENSD